MARDFSKTVANNMALGLPYGTFGAFGALISGAAAMSMAAWVNLDATTTGADDNTILSSTLGATNLAGIRLMVDGTGATRRARVAGRSTSGDTYQARNGTGQAISLSAWQHVGGVMNFTGDSLTPYANGVADNGGAVTFGSNTYTFAAPNRADAIASNNVNTGTNVTDATAAQVDGRIAEVAAWTIDIGAAGFAMLAAGYSPLFVHPEALAFYMPLIGVTSPEIERLGRVNGTINGTVAKADHPPIRYPVGVGLA